VEHRGKAVHPLVEQRLERLRRHVAAGKAGAAGGDHHVDIVLQRPGLHLLEDRLPVVLRWRGRLSLWPASDDPRRQRVAGAVVVGVRVSETVRTAMPTGMNGRASSTPAMIISRHVSVASKYQSGRSLVKGGGRSLSLCRCCRRCRSMSRRSPTSARTARLRPQHAGNLGDLRQQCPGRRLQVVAHGCKRVEPGCAIPGKTSALVLLASLRNTSGVDTPFSGLASTIANAGISPTASIRSPMPRAISGRLARHIGTSAPSRWQSHRASRRAGRCPRAASSRAMSQQHPPSRRRCRRRSAGPCADECERPAPCRLRQARQRAAHRAPSAPDWCRHRLAAYRQSVLRCETRRRRRRKSSRSPHLAKVTSISSR
jgi:hypothetical protein